MEGGEETEGENIAEGRRKKEEGRSRNSKGFSD